MEPKQALSQQKKLKKFHQFLTEKDIVVAAPSPCPPDRDGSEHFAINLSIQATHDLQEALASEHTQSNHLG